MMGHMTEFISLRLDRNVLIRESSDILVASPSRNISPPSDWLRIGSVGDISIGLVSGPTSVTSEANEETGDQSENENSNVHPESRSEVSILWDTEVVHLSSLINVEGNVDGDNYQGDESSKEGHERSN